ncbi:hypothetical protein [Streptomyces sp. NPDC093225]|uniref:hypothetical protein n=1 Tax=Streptomyces sp. NPDC093225 TaxID=3366034 RepID=UPI003826EEF0
MRTLVQDHAGVTAAFSFDVPFEETLRRHATRPQSSEFGEAQMRDWWKPRDLIAGLAETVVVPELTAEQTATLAMERVGLPGPEVLR